MEMGRVGEGLAPGVQHRQKTAVTAQMLGIAGHGQKRLGHGPQYWKLDLLLLTLLLFVAVQPTTG